MRMVTAFLMSSFGPRTVEWQTSWIWFTTLRDRKLPSTSSSADALQSLVTLLFLLKLLHRENVVEQPFEYNSVAVNLMSMSSWSEIFLSHLSKYLLYFTFKVSEFV